MKKTLLSAAIAAVSLAGFSQGAFALVPSTTPDLEIFMAGASAQDKAITALFNNLCGSSAPVGHPADLDIYRSSGSTPGKDHAAYFCTLTAAQTGLAVDKKVLFHKRSAGGSAQGVNPLVDLVAIDHMNVRRAGSVAAPNCVETVAGSKSWVCAIGGAAVAYNNNPAVIQDVKMVSEVPHAGISDVEPGLFKGVNKPSDAPLDIDEAKVAANLTVVPAAGLLFGVPVSDNLYVALQRAQGLLAGFPNSVAGTACVAGVDSAVAAEVQKCMPSLSKEQIATLMSGQVKNWNEFKVDEDLNPVTPAVTLSALVAGLTYNDTDIVAGVPVVTLRTVLPTDSGNKVHVCKRIDGSGTGAVAYANFLNAPCSSAGMSPDFNSSPAGPVKHEVSGSGDMELCLEDFADNEQTSRQITSVNPDLFTTVVNGSGTTPVATAAKTAWAIGHQSLENNKAHTKHYRFIKIDGVAPTLENAFRGKYLDWAEATYQWRNTISADIKAVVQKVATDAASPSIIASDLNPGFIHAFGESGYLANGKNFAFTDKLNLASPVMPYSHAPGSLALSNCRVPVMPTATVLNPTKPM
jgi:hypothetical protein